MKHKKKRLNKKAIGNEVDWIIAIGVFLIYLTLTFVFFKPGIKAVYNPDSLLSIVETKFRDTAYWDITTQPMFVEAVKYLCDCGGVGGYSITDFILQKTNSLCGGGSTACMNANGNSVEVEFTGTLRGNNIDGNFPITLGDNGYTKENLKLFFIAGDTAQTSAQAAGVTETSARAEATEDSGTSGRNTALGRSIKRTKNTLRGVCSTNGWTPSAIESMVTNIKSCCNPILASENPDEEGKEKCEDALGLVSQYEALTTTGEETVVERSEMTDAPAELRDGYINNFKIENNNLVFTPLFKEGIKTKYLLTYSSDVINTGDTTPPPADTTVLGEIATIRTNYDKACIIGDYNPNNVYVACHARYELGVGETFKGLSLRRLESYADFPCPTGTDTGYKCIKEKWDFPANKEFKIRVYTTKLIAEFPKQNVIPTNVNVYSKQFSSFILTEDGLRQPVTVNILVW